MLIYNNFAVIEWNCSLVGGGLAENGVEEAEEEKNCLIRPERRNVVNCIEGGEEIEIITGWRIGEAEPRITKERKKREGVEKVSLLMVGGEKLVRDWRKWLGRVARESVEVRRKASQVKHTVPVFAEVEEED